MQTLRLKLGNKSRPAIALDCSATLLESEAFE